MKVTKGEIFVGDSFKYGNTTGTVLEINYDFVLVGFHYSKKTGWKRKIKLKFNAKES